MFQSKRYLLFSDSQKLDRATTVERDMKLMPSLSNAEAEEAKTRFQTLEAWRSKSEQDKR